MHPAGPDAIIHEMAVMRQKSCNCAELIQTYATLYMARIAIHELTSKAEVDARWPNCNFGGWFINYNTVHFLQKEH